MFFVVTFLLVAAAQLEAIPIFGGSDAKNPVEASEFKKIADDIIGIPKGYFASAWKKTFDRNKSGAIGVVPPVVSGTPSYNELPDLDKYIQPAVDEANGQENV